MKKKIKTLLILFLPIQLIGLSVLSLYPEAVEKHYSQTLFPIIAQIEHFLFGWIPFSVGDLLYIFFGIALIHWVYRRIRSKFRQPEKWLTQMLITTSILLFSFQILWGLNYYRMPLQQTLGLKTAYSQEELIRFTEDLITLSNRTHEELSPDSSKAITYNFTSKELNLLSLQSYDYLTNTSLYVNYKFKNIKPSVFSIPLSYMGFSGYLNPLTNEAHINTKVPLFKMPTLITHEMAHQIGFAKENEANFIAALVTIEHKNPYFRYSGLTFALQYCLSDLAKKDPEKAQNLVRKIQPGIRKNYEEVRQFWSSYQNAFEPVFETFYDGYLKLNQQPDGMQTYHFFVGLLVNYYQGEQALKMD